MRVRRIPRRTVVAASGPALIISWIPDLIVWATGVFPGTTAAGVLSLMSLHVISAALAFTLLVGYGLARE